MNHKAINQYQNVGLRSEAADASPHRMIQMLLEGALKALATAKGHLQRGENAQRGEQISKAISIVGGLQGAIDPEDESEVARNLDRLYGYMTTRLMEANRRQSEEMLDEVAQLLIEVKSGWDAIPPEHHQTSRLKTKGE